MRETTIQKQRGRSRVEPNLPDLDADRRPSFSWASERAALDGLPGGAASFTVLVHDTIVCHRTAPL
jgi:hypothetical protein